MASLHSFLSLPVSPQSHRRFPVACLLIFLLHILFFNGSLDIFFTSPVVEGISSVFHAGLPSPPAQRVVLFVVDGLSADTLYHDDMSATPHLRRLVKSGIASGLSIARTPTLSRPGHLSLLSGVYELMHGLSRPPSEMSFDSVANRSSAAFLLGESEVVELFAHAPHVHALSFPAGLNDFSMAEPWLLDRWVFRRLHSLLHNSSFPSRRLLFMAHLLGVDTFSHSRSASPRRLAPLLSRVDAEVARVEEALARRLGPGTAFVLTADHGMAAWSAHGAGDSREETETPLLVWGAGVRGGGGGRAGLRVGQVDVCALLSALLDVPFPTQSVGRVPLALLNVSTDDARRVALANARQLAEQFLTLRARVKARVWLFKDFRVSPARLRRSIEEGRLQEAMDDAVKGLYHFHKHDNGLRRPLLVAGFALLLIASVIACARQNGVDANVPLPEVLFFLLLLLCGVIFLLADGRGLRDLAYLLQAVYLAWAVYRNLPALRPPAHLGSLAGLAVAAELMVVAASRRRFFAVPLLLQTAADAYFVEPELRASLSARLFRAGSLVCAAFMFLPRGWPLCFPLVYAGPLVTVCVVIPLLRRHARPVAAVLVLQLFLILVSSANHFRTHWSIHRGHGMPAGATVTTKTILLLAPLLPGIVSRLGPHHDVTLLSLWLSVTAAFTPFCLFAETVFLLAFGLTLGAWVSLHRGFALPFYVEPWPDTPDVARTDRPLRHAYLGLCFLLYMYLGCYGIGNESNISSYDPHFVLCFQGVFDLNVMILVVFLKNALPLVGTVGCFLTLQHDVNRLQILRGVVVWSGVVSLHNFFLIREDHEWLEFAGELNHFTCNLLFMAFLFIVMPFVALLFPVADGGKPRGPESLTA